MHFLMALITHSLACLSTNNWKYFFTETALTPTVVSQEEDLMIMVLTETYDHLSPSQKSLYSYTCSNKADGNLTGEHHYHEKRPETATIV